MADREVDDALERSFLADLPPEVVSELRAGGERADYPAGTTIYQPRSEPQTVLVVRGLLRNFLVSPEGRQVTYRYTRPGDVLGIPVLVGGPVNVGVQTVEPSSLFRISSWALTAAARRDSRVSWAIAEFVTRGCMRTWSRPRSTRSARCDSGSPPIFSTLPPPSRSLLGGWPPVSRSRNWPMRPGRSARWWPGCCAS